MFLAVSDQAFVSRAQCTGLFLLLVLLAPHDSNVVVYVQVIAIIILSLKFWFIHSCHIFFYFFFFRPAALTCFLVVVPFLAFPILLHQFQEKRAAKEYYLCFERNGRYAGCLKIVLVISPGGECKYAFQVLIGSII